MKKFCLLIFALILMGLSLCLYATISELDTIGLFRDCGYDINLFNQKEKEINDNLTKEEAEKKYQILSHFSSDRLKESLANSCLVNPFYDNIHYFLDKDKNILPKEDVLFEDKFVIEGNWITNLTEDKNIGKYKRICAAPNGNIQRNAFKKKNITDFWAGPFATFDPGSVAENQKLEYVKIDPNVKYIDEDAFLDNPNIKAYHVCGENYDNQDKNNKISYIYVRVPGEIPPLAFVVDNYTGKPSYFLQTQYEAGEITFYDAYKGVYYTYDLQRIGEPENTPANEEFNMSIPGNAPVPGEGIVPQGFVQEEVKLERIGGAEREAILFKGIDNYDILSVSVRYIDIDGVLFKKDEKAIHKGGSVLMFYPSGREDTGYTIPEGLERVGNSAFRSAKHLKTVVIPESVTEIGDKAFYGSKIVLKVVKGSYGEKYAKTKKIRHETIVKE